MKYLFSYLDKYYDINNKEVVISNDLPLHLQVNLYGFDLSTLKTLNRQFLAGTQLATAKATSSDNLRLNIKNDSSRFLIIKLDKNYENLQFPIKRKMLVSKDGVTWRNYYDYTNYNEVVFNIPINVLDVDSMNPVAKSETLSIMDYTRTEARELDLINTDNMKYIFIQVIEPINIICTRDEITSRDYLILNEKDLTVTCNKEKIHVKNSSKFTISTLGVKIIKSSDIILNTLKEF